jgi:hypothetical protein
VIHWPERYSPTRAPVYVRNELLMEAPIERVWAWLIRAPLWPTWYPNSKNVVLTTVNLEPNAQFTWSTFGVSLNTNVVEFEAPNRVAWIARGMGVEAYHAWYLESRDAATYVLTEETQYGWAARIGDIVFPGRMYRYHQVWLEQLARVASSGSPP